MSFDFSWFKTTGLSAAQHAASAVLSATGGTLISAWDLNVYDLGGIAIGAAVFSVLWSVKSYKTPGDSAASSE